MFLSSKKHIREPAFAIELQSKMSIGTEQLVDFFFDESVPFISERFIAANFLQKCYLVICRYTPKIIRKPLDGEIRRSIIECGQCYFSRSIFGDSLRSDTTSANVQYFLIHLRSFHQSVN